MELHGEMQVGEFNHYANEFTKNANANLKQLVKTGIHTGSRGLVIEVNNVWKDSIGFHYVINFPADDFSGDAKKKMKKLGWKIQ